MRSSLRSCCWFWKYQWAVIRLSSKKCRSMF
jgi:hypothetical protein